MAAHCLLGFLALLCYFLLLLSAANEEENHEECPKSFPCAYLGEIHFPFTNTTSTDCGLPIKGCDDPDAAKEVLLGSQTWHQIDIFHQESNLISIRDHEFENLLSSRNCNAFNYDASATIIPPGSPMMSMQILHNMTFFKCNKNFNDFQTHENIFKYTDCPDYDIYFHSQCDPPPRIDDEFSSFSNACSAIHLPIRLPPFSSDPFTVLSSELLIEITLSQPCSECYYARGGQCLLETKNQKIHCVDPHAAAIEDKRRVITGLSIALAGVTTIALFAILLLYKRRHNSAGYQNQPRNIYSGPYSNTNTESRTVYFGVPVFSYEELQEATNNFDQARELGEGGFGTVYYGNLRDGREVAVKRLYERNYRPVESFINEIQILTRLRHRNLVSLYGCTSRHSRELLLVYEYVPNGTVGFHLHGDQAKPGLLPWPVRMKIAIETASALTYLHASDIIHRDVKTSNILLDNNFCVKVADFGLSRLFPNDVTHVSTAPQGTPGYVDPEYRQCYQLTSKSDVYSFGVVLVELISSMPAVDMTKHRDEVKLANLAIKKIQKREFGELVDPSLGFQSDTALKKMIISVAELAFQCLQRDKELRPSMGEVLDVLQRIEGGKDEPKNLVGIDGNGAGVSHSYAQQSLPNTVMKPQRLHRTL